MERTPDQKKFRELVNEAEDFLFEKTVAYAELAKLTDDQIGEILGSIYESELAEKYQNWVMD